MSLPLRHALVTGGSRGIGLAIAQLLAANSFRITLLSRSECSLRNALSTLPPVHDPHRYIAGDISKPDFWTKDGFGSALNSEDPACKIDVLINCAGTTQRSLFVRMDRESIGNIVETNLTAMMVGTRYLLRNKYFRGRSQRTITNGEGFSPVIINIASLLGVKGGHGAVAYAASKAGVLGTCGTTATMYAAGGRPSCAEIAAQRLNHKRVTNPLMISGFTRSLAEEIGGSTGIRVNAIIPGYISTDMTSDLEGSQNLRDRIPLGRFGKPSEVADAALFLTRNQYASNCALNLDGGLSAT